MRILLTAGLLFITAPALAGQEASSGSGRVYMLSEVTTMPRATNVAELRDTLQASYPAELRAAGVSGTVDVALVVGPDGTTRDVQVVHSTDPAFDSATVAALRVLRFTPAALDGTPVAVRVDLPIQWQVAEPPAEAAQVAADAPAAAPLPANQGKDFDEVPPRIRNAATLRRQMEQHYPERMRGLGMRGTVVARLRVDEQGDVIDAMVVRSTNQEFDEATMRALRQVKFHPATVNGRAVKTWVELPIEWGVYTPPGGYAP